MPPRKPVERVTPDLVINAELFYQALDWKRRKLRLTWLEVATQAGIEPARAIHQLVKRLGVGGHLPAELDRFALLLMWLGTTDLRAVLRPPAWRPSDALDALAVLADLPGVTENPYL